MIASATLIELTLSMLKLVLMVSLPAVLTAAVVGLLVGIAQAVTQLQDQCVPFAIKLIAVAAVIAMTAGWAGSLFSQFLGQSLAAISRVV
jgi:type III secretion protein S